MAEVGGSSYFMRIAVTSDIHANLPSLEKFLERARFDIWVDLGDCIGYYPFPSETLEILKERCDKAVIGDHGECCLREDYSMLNQYARRALKKTREMLYEEGTKYLKSLKKKLSFEIEGNRFLMVHGSPRNPLWDYVFPYQKRKIENILKGVKEDFLLVGHTHVPYIIEKENTTLINPGSLGQPRDGKQSPSYCILDSGEAEIKRFSYDIDKTAERVQKESFPDFLAERLYLGK